MNRIGRRADRRRHRIVCCPIDTAGSCGIDGLRDLNLVRDLCGVETIDVVDETLGASTDMPTLDGQVSVKVPAGTQPDSCGYAAGICRASGGGSRCGPYVRPHVHVPERSAGCLSY